MVTIYLFIFFFDSGTTLYFLFHPHTFWGPVAGRIGLSSGADPTRRPTVHNNFFLREGSRVEAPFNRDVRAALLPDG